VPVAIILAALSPASIRLAGELADGWAPFLWARSRVQDGRTLLSEGESRVETGGRTSVSVGVPVALGPDESSARGLAAWWLSTYATRMGPLYPRLLDQAQPAVAAWFAAGADRVQLVLPPGRPEDELAEIVAATARVVSATSSDLRLTPSEPKLA
jgi:alkanesulfonate monooxygenase SsuD/methylene tetrahydromethanopterin reductase-like flavin-dependent oxidoreductase (luciferase family)